MEAIKNGNRFRERTSKGFTRTEGILQADGSLQSSNGKKSKKSYCLIFITFFTLFIFLLGLLIGYNNGVSYSTHHLLFRDKLNHILPEQRTNFLYTNFSNICDRNTYFRFVECSTNFGLYSSGDLCFICEGD